MSDTLTYLLLFLFFSISDGVLRSVSLSDQRFGENEERRHCGELRRSDAPVALPCQRTEELHPCSPQQRHDTGTL